MREIVAGEAQLRSCVSKTKLTFGPNWILSPDGIVSKRLSSRTELSDSIHSGSMSPSQMIQDCTSCGSLTTWRAAYVSTPSLHSRVSMSICPRSWINGNSCSIFTIDLLYLLWWTWTKGGQNITPQSFNNMVKVWTQEYASQTGHSITPGAYLIKSRYIPFNAIHNERFPTVIMLL